MASRSVKYCKEVAQVKAYQCQAADHNHSQNKPLKILMLHKRTHIETHPMPSSPNTRLFVTITVVALAVAESRTTRADTSCRGSAIAALHCDDRVTLRLVTRAAWWNA